MDAREYVAARSLTSLIAHFGLCPAPPGWSPQDAVLVRTPRGTQLWTRSTLSQGRCNAAWDAAFPDRPREGRHVDHVFPRCWLDHDMMSYQYIRLELTRPAANASAGAGWEKYWRQLYARIPMPRRPPDLYPLEPIMRVKLMDSPTGGKYNAWQGAVEVGKGRTQD